MLVSYMQTPRGNPAKNQFIIHSEGNQTFKSYNSVIAIKTPESVVLDKVYWNYSRTTSNYRNQFLGEGLNDTRDKIESGEYTMGDLN